MDTFTSISACRICGSSDLQPVLSLGYQCLTGVFPRSTDEGLTRGPLELVKCCGGAEACGLIQLQHTYNPEEMYGANYGYRSALNASMVDHLRRKVSGLQTFVPLDAGDLVLDIGSNDGTTLSFYSDRLERVGMDPTAAKFREFYPGGVHVIADFFTADAFDTAFGGRKARIVTSIAMLYDLARPLDFARDIESILADDGIWHFEQSYLPSMLATTGYDTICHEHVEYYALGQIEWIMKRSGLRIIDVELNEVNGGSFGVTVCKSGSGLGTRSNRASEILAAEADRSLTEMRPLVEFAGRVARHRESLLATLHRLVADGSLIVGYGASTKGNVILQYCGIGPQLIPCFAEVNPDKFGAFTPGSGIPIVPESEAHAMKPDYLLAMPWHFRANLVHRERDYLQAGGRMIFPLPKIEIVRDEGR